MKHISEFFILPAYRFKSERRSSSIDYQPAIHHQQKGSHEWETFNVISHDVAHFYQVRRPRTPIIITAHRNHLLRIIYPPAYLH